MDSLLSAFNIQSLTSLSGNKMNLSYLEEMARDPRRNLYVLIGPIKKISVFSIKKISVYCCLEVYLEGPIPDAPQDECNLIKKYLDYIIAFRDYQDVFGARVVNVFTLPDRPAPDLYAAASVKLLTSYFNGDSADTTTEVSCMRIGFLSELTGREIAAPLHYLGLTFGVTTAEVSIADFEFWEGLEFVQIFCAKLGQDPLTCAMVKVFDRLQACTDENGKNISQSYIFECFRAHLLNLEGYNFKMFLDARFLVRILKFRWTIISPTTNHCGYYRWKSTMNIPLKHLLNDTWDLKVFEMWEHNTIYPFYDFLRHVACCYFVGVLPLKLTEREEIALVSVGIRTPPVHFDDKLVSDILIRVIEHYIDHPQPQVSDRVLYGFQRPASYSFVRSYFKGQDISFRRSLNGNQSGPW